MSFRSYHEQLRRAREILNLRDDAEAAQVLAATLALRADTEAGIAASRPSIQQSLREAMDTKRKEGRKRDSMIHVLNIYLKKKQKLYKGRSNIALFSTCFLGGSEAVTHQLFQANSGVSHRDID